MDTGLDYPTISLPPYSPRKPQGLCEIFLRQNIFQMFITKL
jgi:hypothetical protein